MSATEPQVPFVNVIAPSIYVKVERNSKGYNWEASVSNALDVDSAIALLLDAEAKLREEFGEV